MKDKENIIKIFISFLIYILALYINEWFAINAPNKNQKPLFDRGHELFPYIISGKIPDIILMITMIYFLIRWSKTNIGLLSNYFILVGMLFILRVFLI